MNTCTLTPRGFGLIIIGTEILDGRRKDKHFEYFQGQLAQRHFPLCFSLVLKDDFEILVTQLQWAMSQNEHFFCCGGIGATPDDYTRQCAAKAGGSRIAIHPKGAEILRNKWGREALARIDMVKFPEGSTLIPNPVNQVPGFTFRNGHFLPGFPEMAHPMMAWVLNECYEKAPKKAQYSIRIPNSKESDLIPLMQKFTNTHPEISFSSLPKLTETGTEIELSVDGLLEDAENGLHDLIALLEIDGISYQYIVS